MKQITMSTLGNNGRLGNQLFQYASLIGLAKKFGAVLQLPPWPYAQYFQGTYPEGEIAEGPCIEVREQVFNYIPEWPPIKENQAVDIWGYLQSYKYWLEALAEVASALAFKQEFVDQVIKSFKDFDNEKRPIAISIRRGDYVSNPNYAQLGVIGYYYLALDQNFPDWRQRQVIIFSDDIAYCRVHFGGLSNVVFSENNSDIEDICLMSQCHDFVIGNSTFAFWGAYLRTKNYGGKVVRPARHFDGPLARKNKIDDYYPPEWVEFSDRDWTTATKRIEAKDVCFTIPVFNDHSDRIENLELCIRTLKRNFDCDIVVMEQRSDTNFKGSEIEQLCEKLQVQFLGRQHTYFHRTKMLNDMAKFAYRMLNCNIIFNWDADVFIPPLQILESIQVLRSGKADISFPYNWAFARMPRNTWFVKIRDHEDIGMVGSTQFNGMTVGHDVRSVGGAVGFRYDSFVAGGMENEKFISYGPEDVERVCRFEKLGYRIHRTVGPNLYHMNHWCGPNSNTSHPHYISNQQEVLRIQKLNADVLEEEILTWPWVKNALDK